MIIKVKELYGLNVKDVSNLEIYLNNENKMEYMIHSVSLKLSMSVPQKDYLKCRYNFFDMLNLTPKPLCPSLNPILKSSKNITNITNITVTNITTAMPTYFNINELNYIGCELIDKTIYKTTDEYQIQYQWSQHQWSMPENEKITLQCTIGLRCAPQKNITTTTEDYIKIHDFLIQNNEKSITTMDDPLYGIEI